MCLIKFFLPVFSLYTSLSYAAAPSGQDWLTFKSPHFHVHHTAPLETYARKIATSLEGALPLLEKDLKWNAPTPIDIVIMDPSDSPNGFAANFPTDRIEMYAAPFDTDSTLGHYNNWVQEISTHELTHIIANDTTRGAYNFLRAIFGSWVRPNGIQPTWLIEGLAVYEETSLTNGGRGRSPLLETMLRTYVANPPANSDEEININRLGTGPIWWPEGSSAYLYGYLLNASAQSLYKESHAPGLISFENANEFPFDQNGVAKDAIGYSWPQIWASAMTKLNTRYKNSSPQNFCALTASGKFTGGQALSKDGWLYFSEQHKEHGYHLARVRANADCGNTEVERITRQYLESPTQVAVSENGKLVAFTKADFIANEYLFNDIFLWNAETDSIDRVTSKARAKDPAFIGNDLVYIQSNPDASASIVRHNLSSDKMEVIFKGEPAQRISGLFGRGERLVFALHNNNGLEQIYEWKRLNTAEPLTQAVSGPQLERNPFIAANGDVYFAGSYGKGTQNIYKISNKRPVKVAGSWNGYLDRPVLLDNNNTLLVSTYTNNGQDIARMELNQTSAPEPEQDLHEFFTGQKAAPRVDMEANLSKSEPYSIFSSPASSIFPHYWLPHGGNVADGYTVGAQTSGSDALSYHQYILDASYDSRSNFPVFLAQYENRITPVNLLLRAEQTNSYFQTAKTSNKITEYSAETFVPFGHFVFSFGSAHRTLNYFTSRRSNFYIFQNFQWNHLGSTPMAMEPNYGGRFSIYTSLYPTSASEGSFLDVRPKFKFYTRGLRAFDSISFGAMAGISTNKFLASNYYIGGGITSDSDSDFIVRGYPSDTLLGQKIATANISYMLPLFQPYVGFGILPLFLQNIGLKLNADAGSATYISHYKNGYFNTYQKQNLGLRTIYGFGADLIGKGYAFYHVPFSIIAGIHKGALSEFGGEVQYQLGISFSSLTSTGFRSQK